MPSGPAAAMASGAAHAAAASEVEVRRSARRTRTVSAYRDGEKIVVLMPARLTRAQGARWVEKMVADVVAREQRLRNGGSRRSDAALIERARVLNRAYLDGRADPASVAWVDTMARRWASCTAADRSIRLSRRLQPLPPWVTDYVLLHELAHLLVAGHGTEFWALVNRFPRAERARGYLEGLSAAASLDSTDVDDGQDVQEGTGRSGAQPASGLTSETGLSSEAGLPSEARLPSEAGLTSEPADASVPSVA